MPKPDLVPLVLLGPRGVGKSAFVSSLTGKEYHSLVQDLTLPLFNREVCVRIFEGDKELGDTRPRTFIIFFNLTIKETVKALKAYLQAIYKTHPMAAIFVLGTHREMKDKRAVDPPDKLVKEIRSYVGASVRYFEVNAKDPREVEPVFQQTVAIPYINEKVFVSTPPDAEAFAIDAIEWCLETDQFTILAHLQSLGYSIPMESIEKYPLTVGKHLIQLRPLCALPSFSFVTEPSDPYDTLSYAGELSDLEESMQVHDERSQLQLELGWFLGWRDLSLFNCPFAMLQVLSMEQLQILVHVDISHNNLSYLPREIMRLPSLDTLDVSHNNLTRLPHPVHWGKGPRVVNASHNSIINRSNPGLETKLDDRMLAPRLWYLDLSCNNLSSVPSSILRCPNLFSVNLQGNCNMKEISPSISSISSLRHVSISTDVVIHPPVFIAKQGSAHLLRFLQEQKKNPKPWNRHRLILVGPHSSGKTALSATLRGEPHIHATRRGLSIDDWSLEQSEGFFRRSTIKLDVWDFAGDTHLRPIYSSFKCQQSLHLLVFDATRYTSPKPVIQFLAEMQSQCPHPLPALMVIAKMDMVLRDQRDSCKQFWKTLLEGKVVLEKGTYPPLLPHFLGIHFVSRESREGIAGLQGHIYRLLRQLDGQMDPKVTFGLGLSVPSYYLTVDEAVHKIREDQRKGKTKVSLNSMARVTKEIVTETQGLTGPEVKAALRFLSEAGIIVLTDVEGITLVSLDPMLLSDLAAKLIKAVLPKKKGMGKGNPPQGCHPISIDASQLETIWGTDKVGVYGVSSSLVFATMKQKRLFVTVDTQHIVVPPFLDACEGVEAPPNHLEVDIKRGYTFDYLPECLLSQLMCILTEKFVGEVSFSFSNPTTSVNLVEKQPFKAGEGQITLWSNGFLYKAPRSGLRVDLDREGPELPLHGGRLSFRVWGSLNQQSHLLRLACHDLHKLLQECFPGLLVDREGFSVSVGVPYSTIKSPLASQEKSTEVVLRRTELPCLDLGGGILYYSLNDILKQSTRSSAVTIVNQTVPLRELIPDYQLQDLPMEILEHLEEGQSLHHLQQDSVEGGFFLRRFPSFQQAERESKKMKLDIRKTLLLTDSFNNFYNYLKTLHRLENQLLVRMMGFSLTPPSVKLEQAPCGSLRNVLRSQSQPLENMDVHTITLQLIAVLEFVHNMGVRDLCIHSGNILVWKCKPVPSIKLSDKAIPTQPHSCKMCIDVADVPCCDEEFRKKTSVLQLGILIYELATGKQPLQDVHPPSFIITSALHGCLHLSVEAQIRADHMALQQSNDGEEDESVSLVTGCQRMCLQTIINDCLMPHNNRRPTLKAIRDRLCLCVGGFKWSPLRMSISVECLHCAGDPQCVYWVSGSRGLIVGNFNPDTGEVFRHIILEAPVPSSGMFANRKGKPVPLAVGHATCLTVVKATMQLWVGTENGSKGSLHVFNLPHMKDHHSIHLQDAVLSLLAVNGTPQADSHPELRYRVFAGLANGSIVMFSGMHMDKVVDMPLHGARKVIITKDRGPCLSLVLDPRGRLWYSRGDSVEVIDPFTLQHIAELSSLQFQRPKANLVLPSVTGEGAVSQEPLSTLSVSDPNVAHKLTRKVTISYKPKPEVIIQLAVSPQGMWSVARRSTKLFCWDLETGKQRVMYDINSAVESPKELDEISVLRVHGRALWVGTRAGFILILDREKVEKGEAPLLGLQWCGEGRVSDICPLFADSQYISRMRVMCSLEHYSETSGLVMTWEYHPHLDSVRLTHMKWTSSRQSTSSVSSSDGLDKCTPTMAKVHSSPSKTETSAGGAAFDDSYSNQADNHLVDLTGSNHGDSTKPVDGSTTNPVNGVNDAIGGSHGDAATPTTTETHGSTTDEFDKEDTLTQPPSKPEPHKPFTTEIVSNDFGEVVPAAEASKQNSDINSSTKMPDISTEKLSNSSTTEPLDLAPDKKQLTPESGETSLPNSGGDDMEVLSGGKGEEHSISSWEVVSIPPVASSGCRASSEMDEHIATREEEGTCTLADGGPTLTVLEVGGEGHSIGSWEPAPNPSLPSTEGGACGKMDEHNATGEEEGTCTLADGGPTLTVLEVGGEGHSIGSWEPAPNPSLPSTEGGTCSKMDEHNTTGEEGAVGSPPMMVLEVGEDRHSLELVPNPSHPSTEGVESSEVDEHNTTREEGTCTLADGGPTLTVLEVGGEGHSIGSWEPAPSPSLPSTEGGTCSKMDEYNTTGEEGAVGSPPMIVLEVGEDRHSLEYVPNPSLPSTEGVESSEVDEHNTTGEEEGTSTLADGGPTLTVLEVGGEGHSIGSWELAPNPSLPSTEGGACSKMDEHNATREEGAVGSPPMIVLEVGEDRHSLELVPNPSLPSTEGVESSEVDEHNTTREEEGTCTLADGGPTLTVLDVGGEGHSIGSWELAPNPSLTSTEGGTCSKMDEDNATGEEGAVGSPPMIVLEVGEDRHSLELVPNPSHPSTEGVESSEVDEHNTTGEEGTSAGDSPPLTVLEEGWEEDGQANDPPYPLHQELPKPGDTPVISDVGVTNIESDPSDQPELLDSKFLIP